MAGVSLQQKLYGKGCHTIREKCCSHGIQRISSQRPGAEDNGNIESFHNSIKTDYIWPSEFRDFHVASIEIGKAFSDYNECRPHSSIDYFPPREFKRKFLNDSSFRERCKKKEVEVTLDEN